MAFKVALKKFNPLSGNGESPAPSNGYIFPTTDPSIDGEECLHDCETCTVHLPRKFAIDETDKLYGEINGWSRHVIVATGKSDWVRDVADEKGSVMEAVGKWKEEVEKAGKGSNGVCSSRSTVLRIAASRSATITIVCVCNWSKANNVVSFEISYCGLVMSK